MVEAQASRDGRLRVVVLGAGVAGAIMARRLARLPQLDVIALERVDADDHSEAGTGLNVGPNAIKALQTSDPALAADVLARSLPWASWRVSLTDGTELFRLPLAQVADNDGIRIRWSELYAVLREAAGATIHYGCQIQSIGPASQGGGKTRVSWMAQGREQVLDDIDLLIGTDGRYSATRDAFSGLPEPRHIGVAILRALVPDTSGGLVDDYEQWFSGAHRLLAFRVPPDHVYIAATFPVKPGDPIDEAWKTEAVMRATYAPADGVPSAQVRWLMDALCAHLPDAHWARMQESDIRFSEPEVAVLYLGDSAHGMAPTLGQGATQAIEDACNAADVIEAALAAGSRAPRDWLTRIDALRRDRIRFVMDLSVQATDTMLAGADPVAGARWKTEPAFLHDLGRLFRDVPAGLSIGSGAAAGRPVAGLPIA